MTESSADNNDTPQPAAERETRANLSRRNAFLLSKWLRKNRQQLTELGLDREGLAARATTENGFGVSASNVKTVCKDFDIEPMWATKRTPGRATPESLIKRGQLSRLLAKQLVAVTSELERVYKMLGEEFNPEGKIDMDVLRKMAVGKTIDTEAELRK